MYRWAYRTVTLRIQSVASAIAARSLRSLRAALHLRVSREHRDAPFNA